jgi:DNA-binding NarL/FixJ family response regulator
MDTALSQTVVAALQAVTQRGSVEAVQADDWAGIVEDAGTETSDLFVLAPQHIAAGKEMTDELRLGCEGLQHFASRSPAPVVVLLAKEQLAEWRQAYADAGADAVLGLPVHPNTLAEALKRCTQAHGGRPQCGKPGAKESGAAT